uniref:ARAD1B00924p n=1 Tax=Blastobotrys adeninivorans TaxID=409370 RepID=A0A060T9P9_BLAAD
MTTTSPPPALSSSSSYSSSASSLDAHCTPLPGLWGLPSKAPHHHHHHSSQQYHHHHHHPTVDEKLDLGRDRASMGPDFESKLFPALSPLNTGVASSSPSSPTLTAQGGGGSAATTRPHTPSIGSMSSVSVRTTPTTTSSLFSTREATSIWSSNYPLLQQRAKGRHTTPGTPLEDVFAPGPGPIGSGITTTTTSAAATATGGVTTTATVTSGGLGASPMAAGPTGPSSGPGGAGYLGGWTKPYVGSKLLDDHYDPYRREYYDPYGDLAHQSLVQAVHQLHLQPVQSVQPVQPVPSVVQPVPPGQTGQVQSVQSVPAVVQHQQQQPVQPQSIAVGTPNRSGTQTPIGPSRPKTASPNSSHSNSSGGKKKKPTTNTDLYKTELCASYMSTGGHCPYGEKCQFAHGEKELKYIDRPPKWRSKPCQNWVKNGTCSYNARCCFRHDV